MSYSGPMPQSPSGTLRVAKKVTLPRQRRLNSKFATPLTPRRRTPYEGTPTEGSGSPILHLSISRSNVSISCCKADLSGAIERQRWFISVLFSKELKIPRRLSSSRRVLNWVMAKSPSGFRCLSKLSPWLPTCNRKLSTYFFVFIVDSRLIQKGVAPTCNASPLAQEMFG
jgi:hypothetical protein